MSRSGGSLWPGKPGEGSDSRKGENKGVEVEGVPLLQGERIGNQEWWVFMAGQTWSKEWRNASGKVREQWGETVAGLWRKTWEGLAEGRFHGIYVGKWNT